MTGGRRVSCNRGARFTVARDDPSKWYSSSSSSKYYYLLDKKLPRIRYHFPIELNASSWAGNRTDKKNREKK